MQIQQILMQLREEEINLEIRVTSFEEFLDGDVHGFSAPRPAALAEKAARQRFLILFAPSSWHKRVWLLRSVLHWGSQAFSNKSPKVPAPPIEVNAPSPRGTVSIRKGPQIRSARCASEQKWLPQNLIAPRPWVELKSYYA